MGEAHLRAGELDSALARLHEALALQRRIGDRHTAAASHDDLGRCHQLRGDHRSARDHFTRAVELYLATGDDAGAARTRAALAALAGRAPG